MAPIKTKGINIRSVKVGEADKIITIFSKDLGKISAIAKGARKTTSKFGGRLEVFAYNEYLLGEGKNLYVVSQVETVENFWKLREDEAVLRAASFIVRVLDAATEPEHKSVPLFNLLLQTLHLLKEGADPEVAKEVFEIRLMDLEGFFPNLSGCSKCKKKIVREPKDVTFNQALSGLTCSACSKTTAGGVVVPYGLVKSIQHLKAGDFDGFKTLTVNPEDVAKLDMVLKPYISEHIGKDIRNW
jgi:DNA repair protein RecO (recombination protein O)